MIDKCAYCLESFDDPDDLRPYGLGGALVCCDCAMATPERQQEADRQMHKAIDEALSGESPVVIIGGGLPRNARPPRSVS